MTDLGNKVMESMFDAWCDDECNKWKDELVPERLKCFFTTWAYEYRIGKDQDECESLLKRIYENAEVAGFMDYEEFKEYMLQFVK